MGTVADLDVARRRRADRRRAATERAVMHPALRWTAGGDQAGHRRAPDGRTACGADGPLVLAGPGIELCPDCYPSRTGT